MRENCTPGPLCSIAAREDRKRSAGGAVRKHLALPPWKYSVKGITLPVVVRRTSLPPQHWSLRNLGTLRRTLRTINRSCRSRIASMWWARCVALAGPRAGNAIASGDSLELSDALPGIRGVTSYIDRVLCRATRSATAGLALAVAITGRFPHHLPLLQRRLASVRQRAERLRDHRPHGRIDHNGS